jgi:hypothetical protein
LQCHSNQNRCTLFFFFFFGLRLPHRCLGVMRATHCNARRCDDGLRELVTAHLQKLVTPPSMDSRLYCPIAVRTPTIGDGHRTVDTTNMFLQCKGGRHNLLSLRKHVHGGDGHRTVDTTNMFLQCKGGRHNLLSLRKHVHGGDRHRLLTHFFFF